MSSLIQSQIDREYLSEISGGDSEFERELLQTFLDTAPELIEALESALIEENAKGAVMASHTLKGSSRAIGARVFSDGCELAEMSSKAGDLAGCRPLLLKIRADYDLLKQAGQEFIAEAA